MITLIYCGIRMICGDVFVGVERREMQDRWRKREVMIFFNSRRYAHHLTLTATAQQRPHGQIQCILPIYIYISNNIS